MDSLFTYETILLAGIALLSTVVLGCVLVAWPRAVRVHRTAARTDAASRAAPPAPLAPEGIVAVPPAARPALQPAPPGAAPGPAGEAAPALAPEPAVAPTPKPAPIERRLRESDFRRGLRKSRLALVGKLEGLLRGRSRIDDETIEEIEAVLFGADLGVRTADALLEAARRAGSPDAVRPTIEARALEILRGPPSPERPMSTRPHVVMVVGVNGSGKTTSIGKLASRWIREGKRVIVAAGDTYRAAAIEQLGVWAERSGAEIVRGEPGGDPASVAYDAMQAALSRGVDAVIIDTAGRLQTDRGLMDELAKISRVVQKVMPEAPHEVLLVLDANTGQNAIRQAQEFSRAVPVSGIVLTKLDGTAKGGVVLGIAEEVGLPVRYVGLGEGVDDLFDFDPESFVRALFAPPEEQE